MAGQYDAEKNLASKREFPRSSAMALVAYVLDMALENGSDPATIRKLVDEVCTNETERERLISAMAASQNKEVPLLVLEILGRRLAQLEDDYQRLVDMDQVYGVWGQRVGGGVIATGIGLAVTGVLTGGFGALVIAGALGSGAVATLGRQKLKTRARHAERACKETRRLIELIKDARK